MTIYRPPSYSDQENEILIEIILNFFEKHEVLVLGDFNVPSLSSLWVEDNVMIGGVGCVDLLFLNSFIRAGLTQWMSESTFVACTKYSRFVFNPRN